MTYASPPSCMKHTYHLYDILFCGVWGTGVTGTIPKLGASISEQWAYTCDELHVNDLQSQPERCDRLSSIGLEL